MLKTFKEFLPDLITFLLLVVSPFAAGILILVAFGAEPAFAAKMVGAFYFLYRFFAYQDKYLRAWRMKIHRQETARAKALFKDL